jgi:hypothetical protein
MSKRETRRALRRRKKDKFIALLGGKCSKCEQEYHRSVYDFHHINPEDKEHDWHTLRELSWDVIEKEIEKCILLCANCHRLTHAEELEHANI